MLGFHDRNQQSSRARRADSNAHYDYFFILTVAVNLNVSS